MSVMAYLLMKDSVTIHSEYEPVTDSHRPCKISISKWCRNISALSKSATSTTAKMRPTSKITTSAPTFNNYGGSKSSKFASVKTRHPSQLGTLDDKTHASHGWTRADNNHASARKDKGMESPFSNEPYHISMHIVSDENKAYAQKRHEHDTMNISKPVQNIKSWNKVITSTGVVEQVIAGVSEDERLSKSVAGSKEATKNVAENVKMTDSTARNKKRIKAIVGNKVVTDGKQNHDLKLSGRKKFINRINKNIVTSVSSVLDKNSAAQLLEGNVTRNQFTLSERNISENHRSSDSNNHTRVRIFFFTSLIKMTHCVT